MTTFEKGGEKNCRHALVEENEVEYEGGSKVLQSTEKNFTGGAERVPRL